MKKIFITLFFFALFYSLPQSGRALPVYRYCCADTIPGGLPASFTDDYDIHYKITNALWLQEPGIRYHIIRWNTNQQYLIARNDANNPSEKGLYTRIDYMKFNNMEPYLWGFCLSVYNAKSDSLAEFTPTKTDRLNPKKGCNGFPFSRMKKAE